MQTQWIPSLLLAGAALGACTTAPPPPPALDATLAVSCDLPTVTLSHDAQRPAPARRWLLDPVLHPLAVCNDGSPGRYVLRKGVGGGARRWIVFLEGGGHCATAEECSERYRKSRLRMSSAGLSNGQEVSLGGIASASPDVNPDFYDANLVFIEYCSSDWHSGDRAGDPSQPTSRLERWHFRGRAIVRAVVEDMARQGLGQAQELLLAGSSAGAAGVAALADDLRSLAPPNARMIALADAAYAIDYPAYDPVTQRESTERPTPPAALAIAADAAWAGRGDASCVASSPIEGPQACRAQAYLYPRGLVSVPTFLRQSQLDPNQLERLISPIDLSPTAQAFRGRFVDELRTQLELVAEPHSVFSSLDTAHTVIPNDFLWATAQIDGTLVRDAVGTWYRDPCSPVRVIEQ